MDLKTFKKLFFEEGAATVTTTAEIYYLNWWTDTLKEKKKLLQCNVCMYVYVYIDWWLVMLLCSGIIIIKLNSSLSQLSRKACLKEMKWSMTSHQASS